MQLRCKFQHHNKGLHEGVLNYAYLFIVKKNRVTFCYLKTLLYLWVPRQILTYKFLLTNSQYLERPELFEELLTRCILSFTDVIFVCAFVKWCALCLVLNLFFKRDFVAFCYVACAANTGFYGFICWFSLLCAHLVGGSTWIVLQLVQDLMEPKPILELYAI